MSKRKRNWRQSLQAFEAKPRGAEPPKSETEQMRLVQRLAGETLVIMSEPGGFFAGVQKRLLELNRARRWKMLARRLRQQLKAARAMNTGLVNGLEQAERAKR